MYIEEQIILVTEQKVREELNEIIECPVSFKKGAKTALDVLTSVGYLSEEYSKKLYEKVKNELKAVE